MAATGVMHIAAFENWDPEVRRHHQGREAYRPQEIACNHCTGWVWATKARSMGLPIVLGTQKYKEFRKTPTTGPGATENVYLRNGDTIAFA